MRYRHGERLRGEVENLLITAGQGVLQTGKDRHGVMVKMHDIVAGAMWVRVVGQETIVGVKILAFSDDVAAQLARQLQGRLVAGHAVEVDESAARPHGIGRERAQGTRLRGVAALAGRKDPLGQVRHVIVRNRQTAQPVDDVATDRFPKRPVVEDGKRGRDPQRNAVDLLIDHLIALQAAGNDGPGQARPHDGEATCPSWPIMRSSTSRQRSSTCKPCSEPLMMRILGIASRNLRVMPVSEPS